MVMLQILPRCARHWHTFCAWIINTQTVTNPTEILLLIFVCSFDELASIVSCSCLEFGGFGRVDSPSLGHAALPCTVCGLEEHGHIVCPYDIVAFRDGVLQRGTVWAWDPVDLSKAIRFLLCL